MTGSLASLRTWDKRGHGPGRREKAHTQTMPSPNRRWNAKNEGPKAHISFTPQKLNKYQNVQQNQTNTKAMANA